MAKSPNIRRARAIKRLQGEFAFSVLIYLESYSTGGLQMRSSSQLTPFVSRQIEPAKGRFERDPKGALSGEGYLKRWKEENGSD